MFNVIVIGAGASGMVTAIVAARRGKKVLLLEKNNKVGKKLLATGNGKCNILNQRPTLERFYSQHPSFIASAFQDYGYQEVKQFFRTIGLELIEAKEGKVFPMSLQALSVVELLEAECEQLGVKILCECLVEKLEYKKSKYWVHHSKGRAESMALVVATGHLSAPQLGGVLDGITFAKSFGHKIIKDFPTLVQLTSSRKDLKQISGVKIESRVTLKRKRFTSIHKDGDVLFTSYGISGLAILDISRAVMEELIHTPKVMLSIDLMPKMSEAQLLSLMKKSLRKTSKKTLALWLQGFINKKLISLILKPLRLENLVESNIKIEHLERIVKTIKAFEFVVNGSRGYQGAEVATGGVDVKEINPKTMQSKKQKGLYFTGEVLDVDGDRGGFNLYFAWVCGLRAGKSV
jgi:hypothetical protein